MCTTLESLHQQVEDRCNSSEGLLRLMRALLEHQPDLSPAAKDYVAALIYYAFHARRKTLWLQHGKVLHSPCGINSGCGPTMDFTLARDEARLRQGILRAEMSPEEIQEIKNRVGRLKLHSILSRIRDMNYDLPLRPSSFFDKYGDINE
jgi:hypothetical protein